MSPSDFQAQSGKRSRETSEVFESVFSFLMGFANDAETIIPQPKRIALVDDDATDGVNVYEEEPLENGGDGNAGDLFNKLPVKDKEELLKDVLGEIVGNMLGKLPEDGKETFLVRCFDGLFPMLPYESQRVIEIKVKEVSSQSREALVTLSAPESPLAIPNLFPADALRPVGFKVRYPPAIGGRGRGGQRFKVKFPDVIGGGGRGRGGGGGQGQGQGGSE
ncbi:hypothetical protein NL676_004769 [Syzygium grande]|nr:hypothetical protein NL676_004769 [Syzygium grande]